MNMDADRALRFALETLSASDAAAAVNADLADGCRLADEASAAFHRGDHDRAITFYNRATAAFRAAVAKATGGAQ